MSERFVFTPEQVPGSEKELEGKSLTTLQEHFIHLYGRRNEIFLPGREPRIDFLFVSIGDLEDGIRKGGTSEYMDRLHARIVSRIFCIANGINDVSLSQGMAEKYPSQFCAYCHQFPCQCGERREDIINEGEIDRSQLEWGIKDWQQHLERLYGKKNLHRGIENITNRLFKEVSELTGLEKRILRGQMNNMDDIESEYRLELADCFAWTIASANYFNVNLENAIISKYGNGCGKCHSNPCQCGIHNFIQLRA